MKNYFDGNAPLSGNENYIRHAEDLITLKPGREAAWLDLIIAKIFRTIPYSITKVRATQTFAILTSN